MNRIAFVGSIIATLLTTSCSTGFQSSSQGVSYKTWDEGHGTRLLLIEGADSTSFKILNKLYGKDRRSAYFKDSEIEGSDPETFVAISEIYAKDKQRVYYQDKPIQGADPATFRLSQDDFARDKRDLYRHARAIKACDPTGFKWLKSEWQIDSKCAYHRGNIVKNADPKTFVPLGYFFAKDKRHVYSSVTYSVIDGADPSSFTVGGYGGSGKDKNGCYMFNKRVSCP